MSEYHYLLLSIFDRPVEEVFNVKLPMRGFMQFGIWKKMTNEQFDCLYRILNTKTLNEDQRYTIFHNTIYIYNSVLKETNRVKNIDKTRERQKKYREANRDKLREKNKKYREANKNRISAQRRAKYRRDKNGTNN